jgi:hypothetical protein
MTNIYKQVYRTTCNPAESKFDIPGEYVGKQIEIIIIPSFEDAQPKYNAETLEAMQEAMDIMDGKIEAKIYSTVEEMNADLDVEDA